jgi:hypothetical protein
LKREGDKMEHSTYALVGIAALGLIAERVIEYRSDKKIESYINRINNSLTRLQDNLRPFGISIDDKIKDTDRTV